MHSTTASIEKRCGSVQQNKNLADALSQHGGPLSHIGGCGVASELSTACQDAPSFGTAIVVGPDMKAFNETGPPACARRVLGGIAFLSYRPLAFARAIERLLGF